jgi:hypothetical protein
MTQHPPAGQGPPHYRGFTITLRRTTVGRTPLDEWSARRRDLYLTTHDTHNRQTCMPPAGFEPTFPASERSQAHALERTACYYGLEINVFGIGEPCLVHCDVQTGYKNFEWSCQERKWAHCSAIILCTSWGLTRWATSSFAGRILVLGCCRGR